MFIFCLQEVQAGHIEIYRGLYTKAYKCELQKTICKACMLCIYKVSIWVKAINFATQNAIKEDLGYCLVMAVIEVMKNPEIIFSIS